MGNGYYIQISYTEGETTKVLDLTPYLAYGGLKWKRTDVDGPGAGRLINGDLIRNRIAVKCRLDCVCRPLTTEEASKVLKAIKPEFVSVTYLDPELGERRYDVTMYSNNIPAQVAHVDESGNVWWTGITFPLIEK